MRTFAELTELYKRDKSLANNAKLTVNLQDGAKSYVTLTYRNYESGDFITERFHIPAWFAQVIENYKNISNTFTWPSIPNQPYISSPSVPNIPGIWYTNDNPPLTSYYSSESNG